MANRKADLTYTTQKYKQTIGSQVNELKANAGKIGKNAIIITGALVASYLVVRLLVGKEKKKPNEPAKDNRSLPVAPFRQESTIISMIKQQIALFLLAIIKQQINAFVERRVTKP